MQKFIKSRFPMNELMGRFKIYPITQQNPLVSSLKDNKSSRIIWHVVK